MLRFEDYLDEIAHAESLEGLLATFSKHSAPFGMDQYSYFNFSILEDNAPICRNDYSRVWTDYYYNEEYYDIDPVFKFGKTANLPYSWGQSNSFDKNQQQLMSEAADYGIVRGITIPSRTMGFKTAFITLVSSEPQKEFEGIKKYHAGMLHVMALHMDAKFVDLHAPKAQAEELTPRELECLKWAVKGKNNPEISIILSISEKTVEAHFTSAFKKLNVFSRTQAVVKSLTLGLIFP